jgi:branched-chain amino acid transport system permease protein
MNRASLLKILGPIVAILVAVSAPLLLSNIYWTSVLTMIVIYALMAASLRTIFTVGEFSLGHVGFMCLGAYASALLTLKAGLPFGLTLPMAGLMSGLVAFVLGHPFMRVKGIYFAILTLVTSESIRLLAFNWKNLTGGYDGLIGFPGAGVLSIPGLVEVDFDGFTEYYYLTLGVVCISLFVLYRLEKSKLGFTWLAIRDADKLAGAVGVNVLRYKIIAFSIASFFGGIGGGLFAHFERALGPHPTATFGIMTTIYLLAYMVVGGKDKFAGPIVGAIVLSLVYEFARPLEEYQPMIIGAIAIAIVMLIPGGIVSIPGKIFTRRSEPRE